MPTPLPIDALLPAITASLRDRPNLVLQAATGAGKTTRIPPALMDAGFAERGRIVMAEPRRLAARAAARRMSHERGSRLGEEIGYHVRFDRQASSRTRILVVTPGILLRMFHEDPYLESVAVLVFDEFHERSLETDLALGLARLVQTTIRPELKLVAMSATLSGEAVAKYLGGCPILSSEGRLHPVGVRYEERPSSVAAAVAVAEATSNLLRETDGDVLAFLPGMQEIRQTQRELERIAERDDLLVLPLHGDLPPEQQDAALTPQSRRKVVLATNVAETSVTVEGITAVIDSGLARQMEFDPGVGLDRLRLVPVSRASADQRTGRAGRTRPGICVRLWSEISHRQRTADTEPEIRRVDLAAPMLHLLSLGEDPASFPWFEPPRPESLQQAMLLLERLGALEDGKVTGLGHSIARLPASPRLGRMLIEGHRLGQLNRVALAAALLSERDPFLRPIDGPRPARPHATSSDVLDRIEAMEGYEKTGRTETWLGPLHIGGVRSVLQVRDQLLRTTRDELGVQESATDGDEAILRSLAVGFPDRVARRREAGSRRGVMVGGRGVVLAPYSAVIDGELFVAIDLDAGEREAFVRQASLVRREWLPRREEVVVEFDDKSEKLEARKRTMVFDLAIEDVSAKLPNDVSALLLEKARSRLDRVLPPEDSEAASYLRRIRWLKAAWPEADVPSFDDGMLRELLEWLVPRCRSFAEVRQTDWRGAIEGKLTHTQRQLVDREAPERIEVPSGNRIALAYEAGKPPVLAVRVQETFGWAETPRLAGGRVPVLVHLLAPNYRPQQITDDLASFWANTYPIVRKELRARYPRHSWPEDPWNAPAERRPKRRS
ncbi:MAG: ATP-dependent helicase HrpB [Gemmataceae bacterium]|nr:ATP-dependent helicase HrpB [Gemmataceae bacterium]